MQLQEVCMEVHAKWKSSPRSYGNGCYYGVCVVYCHHRIYLIIQVSPIVLSYPHAAMHVECILTIIFNKLCCNLKQQPYCCHIFFDEVLGCHHGVGTWEHSLSATELATSARSLLGWQVCAAACM